MASENPHVHVDFYPIITSIYVRFVQTYRSIKLIRYCIEKEGKEQIRNGTTYSDDHMKCPFFKNTDYTTYVNISKTDENHILEGECNFEKEHRA